MAKNFDYRTCSNNAFIKHLEEINPKESTFTEIFTQLNEIYIEYATEIMKINEQRVALLENIRYAQKEYKRILGHGDNKPIDIDDNKIDQEVMEPVQEKEKRGRKKTKQSESVQEQEQEQEDDEDEDVGTGNANGVGNADSDLDSDLAELENIPKMKSDVKGKKGKNAKNVETPVIVDSEPVIEVKKTAKKGVKKTEVKEAIQEQIEPVKETEVAVKKVTKKTTKTVEPVEPIEQIETVKEEIKKVAKKKTATATVTATEVEDVGAAAAKIEEPVEDKIVTKKTATKNKK
jgi:hypothetical protein